MILIPLDALRSREGAAYLGGAALAFTMAFLLLAQTMNRYLKEDELREAFLAAAQDRGDAKGLLEGLKQDYPDDPTVLVLLGNYLVDRSHLARENLDAAEKLYERALQLDPGRTSAAVGLIVARLRLCEDKTPDARQKDIEAAEQLLTSMKGIDHDHPDVVILKGSIALLRGQLAAARGILDSEPKHLPSLAGVGALYWNRGAAALMARDPGALEHCLRAYQFRRWPLLAETRDELGEEELASPLNDPGRLILLAYQVMLTDHTVDPETLGSRCDQGLTALALRRGNQRFAVPGRFLPPGYDLPIVLNAVGVGLFRAKRYEEALEVFTRASGIMKDKVPEYLLNQAEAMYQAGQASEDEVQKARHINESANVLFKLCNLLSEQEGLEEVLEKACTNMAAMMVELDKAGNARNMYIRFLDEHPDPAQKARDLGVLEDRCRARKCLEFYEEAIRLSHPDAAQIRERMRFWRSQ
jgi:tetratricopeptide (TPR) repeat protein